MRNISNEIKYNTKEYFLLKAEDLNLDTNIFIRYINCSHGITLCHCPGIFPTTDHHYHWIVVKSFPTNNIKVTRTVHDLTEVDYDAKFEWQLRETAIYWLAILSYTIGADY